ncbi:MAG TPA: LTA synthase family protein [Casimicrobiaceae bacterium]|nr:LTA synthase family protein [Casimicrobiaceae bacterium]
MPAPRAFRLRLDAPLILGATALAIFMLTRLALVAWTGPGTLPWTAWPGLFAKGAWFDAVVACALMAPLWLHDALLPDRWRASAVHRTLRLAAFFAIVAALLFVAVAEVLFWAEFSTRLNFIALDYLLYTHEVVANIRESYPVAPILGGVALGALVVTLALRPAIDRADRRRTTARRRIAWLAAALLAPAVALSAARLEQMDGSGNAYADELSGNGLFTLAAAARRNELEYDRFYATIDQDRADAILQRLGVERAPLNGSIAAAAPRPEADEPHSPLMPGRPRHVVMITIESMSAEFLGAYGSAQGLTPNLDRLAAEGLRFANFYATGTRTVRGLEAVSLGTPPVPGQSIVRRPGNDHLATIGEILQRQGFATTFVYGGYGYFDNMNAYFGGNDYRVVDRTAIPRERIAFENAWGVADETLLGETLDVIDANVRDGRRSFVHVMTTSNHRPFTYPPGRIDIPSPGGREGGVKYTDWAIGRFLEQARSRPWFDDTLFVFLADHCAAAAGKTALPLAGYRIPLILWAPKLVRPGVYTPVASQIDLPPTLLDVLGVEGDDHFFGRALLELPAGPARAFISTYQSLGYYRDDQLVVLAPGRRVTAYHVDPATDEATPTTPDPDRVAEAVAYYQTAARAFRRGVLHLEAAARL